MPPFKKLFALRENHLLLWLCFLLIFPISLSSLILSPVSAAEQEDQADGLSAEAFIQSEAGQKFQQEDYENALPAFDSLLRTYPRDALVRRYQAITLDRLGRSQEAIRIFQDLLSENPSHIPTHYFLGQAYARQGDWERAQNEWQWVLSQPDAEVYATWSALSLEQAGGLKIPAETRKLMRWYIVGRYGYEYDSNVILRPDDESLASSRDQNAGRQLLDLAVRYRAISKRDLSLDLLYAVRQTIHDDSLNEFNFHSEEFGAQIRKRIQIGSQDVVAGLRYDLMLGILETDLFSLRNQWVLSADTRFTERTRTVFYDRIAWTEFGPDGFSPAETSRDGLYHDIGATHYWYSRDFKSYVYWREELNFAHAHGKNFDSWGMTSRLGVHHPIHDRLELDVSTGVEMSFYPHFSSVSSRDNSRRRDRDWDIYSAVTYRLTPEIGVRFFYRFIYAYNQNNFYDYTRQIGGVHVLYSRSF